MTLSTIAAAVLALSTAAGAATSAMAATGIPITATYQPAAKRYCIRPATLDEAAAIGAPVHRRSCFSERQWRLRGVVFKQPARATELARL